MENAEEVFHFLEDFSKRKPKIIPQELNDYLAYVARTGDPVYQWALVKSLFKEKLINVITDFYEATPSIEIPPYPNVDPFNYDIMKNSLLERLDSFTSAPFTVQRICELLTFPRKQYNRVDKFMRAVEKNILVVSTREPGPLRHPEPENGEPMEPLVNGSDNNSEYNVDVEMEDVSWKETTEQPPTAEPQPSSSDTHISVDNVETRLPKKLDVAKESEAKSTTQYESVTPPEPNVTTDEPEIKPSDEPTVEPTTSAVEECSKTTTVMPECSKTATATPECSKTVEAKLDTEMKTEEPAVDPLIIPEIKVDDVDMTEQRLIDESKSTADNTEETVAVEKEAVAEGVDEDKPTEEIQPSVIEESNSDSNTKEDLMPKITSVISFSSEESSSSSDNTDGNSNSPKNDNETHIVDVQEESNQSDSNSVEADCNSVEADSNSVEADSNSVEADINSAEADINSAEADINSAEADSNSVETDNNSAEAEAKPAQPEDLGTTASGDTKPQIQTDNYSVSDVNSELPQPPVEKQEVKESVADIKEAVQIEVKETDGDMPESTETEK